MGFGNGPTYNSSLRACFQQRQHLFILHIQWLKVAKLSSSSSMETLSSSVSTLNVSNTLLSTPSRDQILHQFKAPHSTHKLPPHTHLHSTTTKPNSFSQKFQTLSTPTFPTSTKTLSKTYSSQNLNKNPASGYAAALLDIAQCNRTLDLVHKDVNMFLKLLYSRRVQAILGNPFVGLEEKGLVVKLVAEKGKFNKHLVGLVKMLIGKSKVGIVKEMLEEFQRIYNEMSGSTQGMLNV